MTYVITRSCCNDATCVDVCPVDCIHPTPDEPGFAEAEMLYINPDDCVDCGACVEACPVSAVYPDHEVPDHLSHHILSNADFFELVGQPTPPRATPRPRIQVETPLSVGVVGSGPSAWYLIETLLHERGLTVDVTVYERLAKPFGLARYGVAPDHMDTRRVVTSFEALQRDRRVSVRLDTEIGRDLNHDDLLASHDAVVYATGASVARELGIPGEELPGFEPSTAFVGWYNDHPDFVDRVFDLGHERAVIVGNGNVALDMARILLTRGAAKVPTDLAPHAANALAEAGTREVLILGRRGPEHAAFTSAELRALLAHEEFDVVISSDDAERALASVGATDSTAGFADHERARAMAAAARSVKGRDRRIEFRFDTSPVEAMGADRVEALALTNGPEAVATGLVLSAIGYRSAPGVGFELDARGVIDNEGGRVVIQGQTAPRTYVVGWAKRGSSGTIGTNRSCSADTARLIIEDFLASVAP